jgi:hypothetical protein
MERTDGLIGESEAKRCVSCFLCITGAPTSPSAVILSKYLRETSSILLDTSELWYMTVTVDADCRVSRVLPICLADDDDLDVSSSTFQSSSSL